MSNPSMPDAHSGADYDELDYSLEVANFLDALERIVTRLFGVAENPNDNEDESTDCLCVTEEE